MLTGPCLILLPDWSVGSVVGGSLWVGRITGVSPVHSVLSLEVPQFLYYRAMRTGETPVIR